MDEMTHQYDVKLKQHILDWLAGKALLSRVDDVDEMTHHDLRPQGDAAHHCDARDTDMPLVYIPTDAVAKTVLLNAWRDQGV
ncbi:hypothetical protein PF003_g1792 [Phytophthora fragariae]|nr:hypothetical protein PF003_g1792 [Phytophthora fragariae]